MCWLFLSECGCETILSLRSPNLHQCIPCVLYLKRDKKAGLVQIGLIPRRGGKKEVGRGASDSAVILLEEEREALSDTLHAAIPFHRFRMGRRRKFRG